MDVVASAPSVDGFLARAAQAHGASLAIVDGALRLTWHELGVRVARLAAALARAVPRGGALALCCSNSAAALEYLLAASALGAMFVPLNARWTDAELLDALIDCGATVLVVDAPARLDAISRAAAPAAAPGVAPGGAATGQRALERITRRVALELAIIAPPAHADPAAHAPVAERGASAPQCACAARTLRHADLVSAPADAVTGAREPGCGEEIAWLVYTSGTTGGAKGVQLSHASCVAHAVQKVALLRLREPTGPAQRSHAHARAAPSADGRARAGPAADPAGPGTIYLSAAPLHHVAGLSATLAVCAAAGCLVIPRSTRAADLRAALLNGASADGSAHSARARAPRAELPVNLLVVVPAHLHALLHSGEPPAGPETGVRPAVQTVLIGGGTPSAALVRGAAAAFPRARLLLTYAATEAGSTISVAELAPPPPPPLPSDGVSRGGSDAGLARDGRADALVGGVRVGVPVHIARVALAPPNWASGDAGPAPRAAAPAPAPRLDAPPPHHRRSELGEIVVRGVGVMRGYWRRPEASAAALRDGWLRTGDLGGFDADGCLVLVGRINDVVKTGGENVHAAEVERALCAHAAVLEAAVVGVPDVRLGERLVAVLVRAVAHDGDAPSAADSAALARDVLLSCRARLAGFKVPRTALWWPAARLPRTASGKVVKWRLRAEVAHELGAPRPKL
ncbi:hypothetical protein KFE25_004651 [Diacronema lutheri]|uniref:Uncharacterized protein n=1 Tax=Diacronema lutheri TaxID=2081491 RepID=A0A8J5XGS0_DIALT|nr:hypothetical protein KFE25_004651 [Diacronema lutheri]